MLFLLPENKIKNECVQFTEKKKNMIIDGTFSKIVYATAHFMSSGIFQHCHIVVTPPGLEGRIRMPVRPEDYTQKTYDEIIDKWENDHKAGDNVLPMYPYKTMYKFDPNMEENRDTVVNLCVMEEQLLEYYKRLHNINKTCVYNLKSALLNGNIKIHEEGAQHGNNNTLSTSAFMPLFNEYALKISGIWETRMNVGLTFKFMYIREMA
jgi:hypothetical protein